MVSQLVLSRKSARNSYKRKIKLLSPAKINLYLNILGKDKKDYHRIVSIVERISLCDQITIQVTQNPSISIRSNIDSIANVDNLCVKAAALIKKKCNLPFGFDIYLKKNIPIGAGLGGGSSNAAVTLLGINNILNLKLTKEELYKLGANLGSDVNFFLSGSQFAVITGRGEKISPFKAKPLKHLIVWPGISLPTAGVYKNCRLKLTNFLDNANILAYSLKRGEVNLIKENIFNALAKSAISLCKELKDANKRLDAQGIFSKVTGSGSCLYTFLDDCSQAKARKLLPERCMVFAVRTF